MVWSNFATLKILQIPNTWNCGKILGPLDLKLRSLFSSKFLSGLSLSSEKPLVFQGTLDFLNWRDSLKLLLPYLASKTTCWPSGNCRFNFFYIYHRWWVLVLPCYSTTIWLSHSQSLIYTDMSKSTRLTLFVTSVAPNLPNVSNLTSGPHKTDCVYHCPWKKEKNNKGTGNKGRHPKFWKYYGSVDIKFQKCMRHWKTTKTLFIFQTHFLQLILGVIIRKIGVIM